jgi:gas vesicle protein
VSTRFILGFLLGFLIGASIALALAPQPGADTRQKVWGQLKERAARRHSYEVEE